MRELSAYRMKRFFADELKRLELFEDLAAGINLEAALAAGRQVRKEEDKQLRAAMQEDQAFQQERKKSKPNPAELERQSMGIFSTSGESLFHR